MKLSKEHQKALMVSAGLILIVILFNAGSKVSTTPPATLEGAWDISAQVKTAGFDQYLIEEADFDYSALSIQSAASQIKSSTSSPFEAVKETAKFVYDNIHYDAGVSVGACYSETASSVLASRSGDCVSMSRLATAILRAQGIPARTMGGCLTSVRGCSPSFAVYPEQVAQVTPLVEGDFKKRGFLHEWVEVWTPERGWQILEATSGQIFSQECSTFLEYGYDNNNFNRCVINDQAFWSECRSS